MRSEGLSLGVEKNRAELQELLRDVEHALQRDAGPVLLILGH